jgi:hypothetical protein
MATLRASALVSHGLTQPLLICILIFRILQIFSPKVPMLVSIVQILDKIHAATRSIMDSAWHVPAFSLQKTELYTTTESVVCCLRSI